MSVAVKVAAFAALLRVLTEAFRSVALPVTEILAALAVLTMVVGNLMAVVQTDVKRMLAYSSIAHAGYLLIGFADGDPGRVVCRVVLPARVRLHEPRRVWRHHRPRGAGWRARADRGTSRVSRARARPWRR